MAVEEHKNGIAGTEGRRYNFSWFAPSCAVHLHARCCCCVPMLQHVSADCACRWVEQQPPWLPAKVFRKVQDDGRTEFSLSRTRANWRRLTLLRDATAPARQVFAHLCSWSNPLHSGGWYCVILLFGVFPSRVSATSTGSDTPSGSVSSSVTLLANLSFEGPAAAQACPSSKERGYVQHSSLSNIGQV